MGEDKDPFDPRNFRNAQVYLHIRMYTAHEGDLASSRFPHVMPHHLRQDLFAMFLDSGSSVRPGNICQFLLDIPKTIPEQLAPVYVYSLAGIPLYELLEYMYGF